MAGARRLEGRLAGAAAALLAALLLTASAGAPAAAADREATRGKLQQVEAALEAGRDRDRRLAERAGELSQELEALRAKLVRAASAAQQREEALTALELRLAELNAEAFLRRDMLGARRQELAGTLSALSRLARRPPAALMTAPYSVIDTFRSARLLAAVTPSLEAEARSLRRELEGLDTLRRSIATERRKLADAKSRLAAEQETVRHLVAKFTSKRDALAAERREMQAEIAALATEAKTLQALLRELERLEAEERNSSAMASLPGLPFSAAPGSLAMPARGRMVELFGVANGLGQTSKGITIATRAKAQVVAPHDGKIVFAGPFRGYGQLLIIAPGDGYHILLAGMSRLYAVVGQSILAGEPVGEMGTGLDGGPSLYVELRRKGKAINPLPLLAAESRKVSG